MRRLLLISMALLFGGVHGLRAQCVAYPWIVVWPGREVPTIQPRQVFLLTGSESLQGELRQLGRGLQLYLWSAHDSVPLLVQDRVLTENPDLQVLMRPARPLLPDSLYELRARRGTADLYYLFARRVGDTAAPQSTNYRWRVARTADAAAPVWRATPAVRRRVYAPNSEGTEHYVLFSYPLQDESPCLVRATVRHLWTGRQTTCYLRPRPEGLAVGYFTCGGVFRFWPEEPCTVTFEAIDAAGNRATATGTPLPFTAPPFSP